MSTRFARRRKRKTAKRTTNTDLVAASAEVSVSKPVAAARGGLEEVLFRAYDFASYNPMARGYILWIWSDGHRVYAVTSDRYLSNALYHALRALGRNRVRRWSQNGKWIVAYS